VYGVWLAQVDDGGSSGLSVEALWRVRVWCDAALSWGKAARSCVGGARKLLRRGRVVCGRVITSGLQAEPAMPGGGGGAAGGARASSSGSGSGGGGKGGGRSSDSR